MTEELAIKILGTTSLVLVWVITAIAAAFVGRYAMRTWWRSLEGRNLMAFTLMFGVTWGVTGLSPVLDLPLWALLLIQLVIELVWVWVLIRRHWMLTNADREFEAERAAAQANPADPADLEED